MVGIAWGHMNERTLLNNVVNIVREHDQDKCIWEQKGGGGHLG